MSTKRNKPGESQGGGKPPPNTMPFGMMFRAMKTPPDPIQLLLNRWSHLNPVAARITQYKLGDVKYEELLLGEEWVDTKSLAQSASQQSKTAGGEPTPLAASSKKKPLSRGQFASRTKARLNIDGPPEGTTVTQWLSSITDEQKRILELSQKDYGTFQEAQEPTKSTPSSTPGDVGVSPQ
jgi:hypothetical protein